MGNSKGLISGCISASYHQIILNYITYRITHRCEAEDLAQDVFVRLLDYKQMLRPDTVKFFIFTIARNLLTDYLRRYYKKQEITSYLYDHAVTYTNETESHVIAKELSLLERHKLETLTAQRKKIYVMSRFDEKSISEISTELSISPRTVENHLFVSRREIREFIKQCI